LSPVNLSKYSVSLAFAEAKSHKERYREWIRLSIAGCNLIPNVKETEMITKLVPKSAQRWLRTRIENIARDVKLPLIENIAREDKFPFAKMKYIPYKFPSDSFVIPKSRKLNCETCGSGLAIPPTELWFGMAATKEEYIASGEKHVSMMLELLRASGFSFSKGDRILDFGCGTGRMIRHLANVSESCEIWGTDVHAESIYWCNQHLNPPFHFATTTTIPHLPFGDSYFKLIYGGSIFTHIDDLAEAWLLELRRILSPDGRLYVTIHDNRSIELLEACRNEDFFLAELLKTNDLYIQSKSNLGMLAIGRDIHAQVFYDIDYFRKMLSSTYQVLSVTKEAYGYQTAVLVKPRSA